MKALIIGPTLADYDPGYCKSIARAFTQCGFETRVEEFFVTTPPGIGNRMRMDGAMLLGYRKYYDEYVASFNKRVLTSYLTDRPDLVFVVRGSKLSADTLKSMSSAVKVLWCHDVIRRCDISIEQLCGYDLRYVFDASDVPWLAERCGLEARHLLMGFDPENYFPLDHSEKDIDVFFVGAYYPSRRAILERLANHFPNLALRFYGRNVRYREPRTWIRHLYYLAVGQGKVFVNRSLNPVEVNQMYSRSKICLNMHHEQSEAGCNPRVFEIMGAGAFQLVDAVPYVRKNLDELATYDGYDTLRQAINFYLSDNRLREDAARHARQTALAHHTYAHRIREVLRDCNLRSPGSSY
jgi:spore maturation protein CgeB